MTPENPRILHATCVDVDGRGLLITGASGAGKSSLALQMIALGACLLADDRCAIRAENGSVLATRPKTLPPAIEARGIGLLNAPMVSKSSVHYVIDLDVLETERLPPRRAINLCGVDIPLIYKSNLDVLGQSLYLLLIYGEFDIETGNE